MTLFASHPARVRLLAELAGGTGLLRERGGDAAVACQLVDWLQDHGALLADVVEAYALPPQGETPDYEDIACRLNTERRIPAADDPDIGFVTMKDIERVMRPGGAPFARTLRAAEESARAARYADDVLRPVLATWLRCQGDARWEEVGGFEVREFNNGGQAWWYVTSAISMWGPEIAQPRHLTPDRARLDLKRRVLRLFGEVRIVREGEVEARRIAAIGHSKLSAEFINVDLARLGFLPDTAFDWEQIEGKRYRVTQTLTPEQLLPPEAHGAMQAVAGQRLRAGDRVDFGSDGRAYRAVVGDIETIAMEGAEPGEWFFCQLLPPEATRGHMRSGRGGTLQVGDGEPIPITRWRVDPLPAEDAGE